jgi:4-hydroxybutyryl-CoA dehydratase/vinylacetyl-CoA-Delta-isomerase
MTLGRNAVGYLTESMHGAGSPQAQRIQIQRQAQFDFKKALAQSLAGIDPESAKEIVEDVSGYMSRVLETAESE